jgi:hypothetical protein
MGNDSQKHTFRKIGHCVGKPDIKCGPVPTWMVSAFESGIDLPTRNFEPVNLDSGQSPGNPVNQH